MIGLRSDGPSRCFHFVSGGLTDVGGMVGIDFDLQNFSVDTACCIGSIRGGVRLIRLAAAAAIAPLEAAAPRPRPRPGAVCRVGVVDVAAPPVRLVRVPAILFLL